MSNKIFAFLLFASAAVAFYLALIYRSQGQPYATHFMIGLGGLASVVGLVALTGK